MKDKKEEIELTPTTHEGGGEVTTATLKRLAPRLPKRSTNKTSRAITYPTSLRVGTSLRPGTGLRPGRPTKPTSRTMRRSAPRSATPLHLVGQPSFPAAPRKLTPGHCVARRRRWSLRYRCIVCGRSFGTFARGGRRGLPLPEWFRWPWRRHPQPPPPPSTPSERSSVLRTLPP